MTKKTRVILFYSLMLLFFLVTPAIVFYSQGYRFDFDSKKITQTGAFYFKVLPKNAEVYLDGKLRKKTDFFFGAIFIKNLLPKKYEVEIKKNGFQSWKKVLEIKEKQVIEAKNIILFPENPSFVVLTKETKDIFFSPDEKKIILKTEITQTTGEKKNWALKLFDLGRNVKSSLIEEKDISKKGVDFLDLKYSSDSKKILIKVGLNEQLKYFLLDLEKTADNLISLDFLGSNIEHLSFNSRDPQKIFFTQQTYVTSSQEKIFQISLFVADYNKKTSSQEILKDLITYGISKENIFWLSKDGYLFKSDFFGKNQEKLNNEPILLRNETEYRLFVELPVILLKEGEALYFFNQDLKNFTKISDSVNNFSLTQDSKKMVYFNNYEIFILFFEKIYEQLQKEAGGKLFLTRFSEKIGDVFWLNNNYLIFNVGDKIKISEIDDRDKINIFDLGDFPESKIFWSEINKNLYILSKENLFNLEKLLP